MNGKNHSARMKDVYYNTSWKRADKSPIFIRLGEIFGDQIAQQTRTKQRRTGRKGKGLKKYQQGLVNVFLD